MGNDVGFDNSNPVTREGQIALNKLEQLHALAVKAAQPYISGPGYWSAIGSVMGTSASVQEGLDSLPDTVTYPMDSVLHFSDNINGGGDQFQDPAPAWWIPDTSYTVHLLAADAMVTSGIDIPTVISLGGLPAGAPSGDAGGQVVVIVNAGTISVDGSVDVSANPPGFPFQLQPGLSAVGPDGTQYYPFLMSDPLRPVSALTAQMWLRPGDAVTLLWDGVAGGWRVIGYTGCLLPPGTIQLFASVLFGSFIARTWIPCDGRELSRAGYAPLFGIISTTYGDGDGSTTFNVPDIPGPVSSVVYAIKV